MEKQVTSTLLSPTISGIGCVCMCVCVCGGGGGSGTSISNNQKQAINLDMVKRYMSATNFRFCCVSLKVGVGTKHMNDPDHS